MEYRGQRSAYSITTDLALENMRDDLHVIYDAIYTRLTHDSSAREHVA